MPRKITPVHHKKFIRLLKRFGFKEKGVTGSHLKMRKDPYVPHSPHLIIPLRPKEVKIGIIRSNLRKAGISREDYFEALDS